MQRDVIGATRSLSYIFKDGQPPVSTPLQKTEACAGMLWNRIAVLFGTVGTAVSLPLELARRESPTALTILEVVALIQAYDLQGFCTEWVAAELDTYRPPVALLIACRRSLPTVNDALRRRQVAIPAVLAFFSDEAITEACKEVENVST